MSGLFGIVNADDPGAYLTRAAQRMTHFEWYTQDTWISPDNRVGLGQMGIGIFNKKPQPVTSANGNLVLFLSGEFYKTVELRKALSIPQPVDDAELALAAFEAWDTGCAQRLEGAFFIVVYDRARQRIVLMNDRFGLYPHYYSTSGKQMVFAQEVKALLDVPFVTRTVNLVAVAEYLRFQHLLGTKTFHEDIQLFPYGSTGVFELETGRWTLNKYWNWDQIPYNPQVSFDEAVLEVGKRFQAGIVRLSSDSLRPGVFLSGGLDSRAIIGMVPKRDPAPITATFGNPESRDVYYAAQIAAAMGTRHQWFDLPMDGSWVAPIVDKHFSLTEGFHSWIHLHGMNMLPTLRGMIDYNLSGWDGGTLMGDVDLINPLLNNPINFSTLVTNSFQKFNQAFTWPGLTEAEENLLYTPAYAKQMQGLAFESYRAEIAPYWNFRHDYSHEFFYLVNHCLRLTINMITFARSYIESRFPFWDYDLVDFVYSLKPEIRAEKHMYKAILTRFTPQLSRIPYDKKEFLPTSNKMLHTAHALGMRVGKRLRLLPNRPILYADYEIYLRRAMRPWAEGLIYNGRMGERGMFNMDYVRDLMERHMEGREEWTIGKISPLISLEMVMQNLFD